MNLNPNTVPNRVYYFTNTMYQHHRLVLLAALAATVFSSVPLCPKYWCLNNHGSCIVNTTINPCVQQVDKGPSDNYHCNEKLEKFFWNKDKQDCQKFIWSGCGGNLNLFDSAERCKGTCSDSIWDRTKYVPNDCQAIAHEEVTTCPHLQNIHQKFYKQDKLCTEMEEVITNAMTVLKSSKGKSGQVTTCPKPARRRYRCKPTMKEFPLLFPKNKKFTCKDIHTTLKKNFRQFQASNKKLHSLYTKMKLENQHNMKTLKRLRRAVQSYKEMNSKLKKQLKHQNKSNNKQVSEKIKQPNEPRSASLGSSTTCTCHHGTANVHNKCARYNKLGLDDCVSCHDTYSKIHCLNERRRSSTAKPPTSYCIPGDLVKANRQCRWVNQRSKIRVIRWSRRNKRTT